MTKGERYQGIIEDQQDIARRMAISGLHVHVGIEDPELRIDLMNQATYFLPYLLSLSTSSPFWEGRDTGLKSYRTSVFSTMPRTGFPEQLSSWADFKNQVNVLVKAGIIEDSSKVWWIIRPSERFPTLEVRTADLPTKMEDSIAIAAAYVCILRMLWRLKTKNQSWRRYSNFLLSENMWRAQRYGISGSLIDYEKATLVPFTVLVEELLELLKADAMALKCTEELEHIRTICRRGTSADRPTGRIRKSHSRRSLRRRSAQSGRGHTYNRHHGTSRH